MNVSDLTRITSTISQFRPCDAVIGFSHLISYLLRDTILRWRGRPLSPLSRLLVAICLASAALLVLASFALGKATLEERIQNFGLNTVVVRSPLARAENPMPAEHNLSVYGRALSLRAIYPPAQINLGGSATIAFAHDATLREIALWDIRADHLPLLLTSDFPDRIHVAAGIGPWQVEAQSARLPQTLTSAGIDSLLIARESDFPMQAQTAGQAITLLEVDTTRFSTVAIVRALQEVAQANQPDPLGSLTVQSALPLLHELQQLQNSWARYAALISSVLALTIAVVFGASAMLEYEITAYTTALLRSFGASRFALGAQRIAEALFLVNAGWGLAWVVAKTVSDVALPQLTTHLSDSSAFLPLILALNGGAFLSGLPVVLALRRQVGMILQ